MKLATIDHRGSTAAAIVVDGGYRVLPFGDVGELLATGIAPNDLPTDGELVADARLRTPVLAPSKVVCVGLNYKKHIEETGEPTPDRPTLFSKFAASLTGPHDAIVVPAASERVDWEAELVAVIGTRIRNASVTEASAAIAGFTVGNDISMRDHQARTSQWLQGKAWDAATPVGPWVLTVDECGPEPDLRISCSVNGVSKQDSRTSDLLFGVPELLAYISVFTALEPGDLVFTGTPGGVGQARPVPEFLHAGDTLVTEIESIGACTNPFVAP